jgi:hypothetical protein
MSFALPSAAAPGAAMAAPLMIAGRSAGGVVHSPRARTLEARSTNGYNPWPAALTLPAFADSTPADVLQHALQLAVVKREDVLEQVLPAFCCVLPARVFPWDAVIEVVAVVPERAGVLVDDAEVRQRKDRQD